MAIYDVPADELIGRTALSLKGIKELTPPSWAIFVKTGSFKKRPPTNPDWWYVRAASVLRKIALRGPIGTSKLRTIFGGRNRRGFKSERFARASGSIIRHVLQQLDAAKLTSVELKKQFRGRKISPSGMALLDKVAAEIFKEKGLTIPQKKAEDVKPIKKKAVRKKAVKKTKKVEDGKS